MAIVYTVTGQDNGFVIGGQVQLDAGQEGMPGPFPRYTVSREPVAKDSMTIGNKYIINVTGTALIVNQSSMLQAGQRQNEIHDLIRKLVFLQSKHGTLEIAPYGGRAKILTFKNTILTSAEAVEQSDTSQGTQNQEYNFVFESYNLSVPSGVEGEDPDSVDDTLETVTTNPFITDPTDPNATTRHLYLSDVSESWDYQVQEEYSQTEFSGHKKLTVVDEAEIDPVTGELPVEDKGLVPKVQRLYSITHTITATGLPEYQTPETPENPEDPVAATPVRSGWIQAKNYVEDRLRQLGTNPLPTEAELADETYPANISTTDHSRTVAQDIDIRSIIKNFEFNAWHLHQTYSKDILEGTYTVTRTWTVAKDKASSSIEFEFNQDTNGEGNTITVSVSISGFESIDDGYTTATADPPGEDEPDSAKHPDIQQAAVGGGDPVYDPDNLEPGKERVNKSFSNKYKNALKHLDRYFNKIQLAEMALGFYRERMLQMHHETRDNQAEVTGTVVSRPNAFGSYLSDRWVAQGYNEPDAIFDPTTLLIEPEPLSFSQTHNQTDGTISITATFNDIAKNKEINKYVSDETVSVTSSNEDGSDQIIAILAVIAKGDGPIIQNMQTTKERKRSISLEWVVRPEFRTQMPQGIHYVNRWYKPVFDITQFDPEEGDPGSPPFPKPDVYQEGFTETWNPRTGQYSLSVDYVWTGGQPWRHVPNVYSDSVGNTEQPELVQYDETDDSAVPPVNWLRNDGTSEWNAFNYTPRNTPPEGWSGAVTGGSGPVPPPGGTF